MAKTTKVSTQLDNLRRQLETDRDEILRVTASLYREREKLVAKIQPLELELRAVDDKIKDAEKPMYDIGNGLAQLARAGGAKIITNGVVEEAKK
jgi:uncharacterized protein YaaN involved in tellurite resistance